MSDDEHRDGNVEKQTKPKSLPRKGLDALLWFAKDQWFLLGIILVTIISSQVQVPASQQATKQVIVSYLAGTFALLAINAANIFSLADLLRYRVHTRYQDSP